MNKPMIYVFAVVALMGAPVTLAAAVPLTDNISPYLNVIEVRTYVDRIVVQVVKDVNKSCAFPTRLQFQKDAADDYRSSVERFLSAIKTGRRVRARYRGCVKGDAAAGGGNVQVTGSETAR
jgi:hypothetical protein